MSEENRRSGDMILAPNEFAFISDETKGDISVFVGPNKTSLAGTDRCVVFDETKNRFVPTHLDRGGVQTFRTAPEGWYVVLENPAVNDKHPSGNGKQTTPELRVGKKINVSGPTSFAMWPGQSCKVIKGHNLRSNEYLIVQVYDEEAAKNNIDKLVVKHAQPAPTAPVDGTIVTVAAPAPTPAKTTLFQAQDLSMGKLFVIKGTEVSFFIPPTGIEVVPEIVGNEERYVREAVSLELLEYCLLLDQNGTKRYVHGPDVVFPKPTEKFVDAPIKSNPEKAKAKKFRAQELMESSGIHIRVITDYTDEDTGKSYKAGEELFITGKEQTIYFPREEHAIIKYGDQEIHYAVAIPAGEARYVLNRKTGVIDLVRGPQIFLPDPRNQVIAQRALPLSLVALLYPGNQAALDINAARLGVDDQDFIGSAGGGSALLQNSALRSDDLETYGAVAAVQNADTSRRVMIRGASKALPGDAFDRKNKFTAPRSVVLNTKYDGAVAVNVWTGYAMLLVSKSGNRRVVQGPQVALLEYDESPQVMSLSRGKPKNTDNLLQTPYLLTTANKVGDIISVETKDYVKVSVKLSYRVNFEGDPENWFNVDNYVKFLCDHMRSRISSSVQKLGIEDFYGNRTEILRNIVLGTSPGDGKPRPGTVFAENGMKIYDVEVLDVKIENKDVEGLLVTAQRDSIAKTLSLAAERRNLEFLKEGEAIKQEAEIAKNETQRATLALQEENVKLRLNLQLAQIAAEAKAAAERISSETASLEARAKISSLNLEMEAAAEEQRLGFVKQQQEIELAKLEAQVKGLIEKAKAVSPDLIAALQAFGDKALVEKVSEAMAPLAILGGGSVVDIVKKLLEGTQLAGVVDSVKLPAKK